MFHQQNSNISALNENKIQKFKYSEIIKLRVSAKINKNDWHIYFADDETMMLADDWNNLHEFRTFKDFLEWLDSDD